LNKFTSGVEGLAIFGGSPYFDEPIPVGNFYFPDWNSYSGIFSQIFERQYYTNHGPLVKEFEEKIEDYLGVRNAICVTNATVGLMMALEVFDLSKKVILPAHTFIATAQAVTWAGLEPVFSDVNLQTQAITAAEILKAGCQDISAVIAVNLWGGACDIESLTEFTSNRSIPLIFDSSHAFGVGYRGTTIGNFGSMEIFSFHATKILNATEGGCITTNDDAIAEKLRNIRSSYGARKSVEVYRTSNGRMSEAQAAIGLFNLEHLSESCANNKNQHKAYRDRLQNIKGLSIYQPSSHIESNDAYLICAIDKKKFGLTRDQLVQILKAENVIARSYFTPGVHKSIPYRTIYPEFLDKLPNTDILSASLLALPVGNRVQLSDIDKVCEIITHVKDFSGQIAGRMSL